MEHYYSESQASEFIPRRIEISVAGIKFGICTSNGIFSKDGLDKGTRLLIEKSSIPPNGRILDLGCGYGVVGIALSLKYPGLDVDFSDVNPRAVKLTEMGIKLNSLHSRAYVSDSFGKLKSEYDSILLNPPYSAGRQICLRLIKDSFAHLKSGGSLQIVAVHNKGGKFLSEYMESVFGNMSVSAKSGGYRVYLSRK